MFSPCPDAIATLAENPTSDTSVYISHSSLSEDCGRFLLILRSNPAPLITQDPMRDSCLPQGPPELAHITTFWEDKLTIVAPIVSPHFVSLEI